jgi:hypothetical protein
VKAIWSTVEERYDEEKMEPLNCRTLTSYARHIAEGSEGQLAGFADGNPALERLDWRFAMACNTVLSALSLQHLHAGSPRIKCTDQSPQRG